MTRNMKILSAVTSFYPLISFIPISIISFMWIGSLIQRQVLGGDRKLPPFPAPLIIALIVMFILFSACSYFNIIYDAIIISRENAASSNKLLWIAALILIVIIPAPIFWWRHIRTAELKEPQTEPASLY